jgi:hypothetical protein
MELNKNKLRIQILKDLSMKKSVYGKAAELAIGNSKLEEDFLIECYEQCHILEFQNFLGKKLFNDLLIYNTPYNNKFNISFKENKNIANEKNTTESN